MEEVKEVEEVKEEGLVERPVMSEEEFKEYLEKNKPKISQLHLQTFYWVPKVRSVRRAIKRGRMTFSGMLCPWRPFNNRANTSKRKGVHSRYIDEIKRHIYYGIRKAGKKS